MCVCVRVCVMSVRLADISRAQSRDKLDLEGISVNVHIYQNTVFFYDFIIPALIPGEFVISEQCFKNQINSIYVND